MKYLIEIFVLPIFDDEGSSSSGRMSIISGCSGTSLGDSGTHSDPEDRRVLRGSREDKGGVMAYEIPPAPKPFTGRYSPMRYTPSPRSLSTNNEHENRRQTPVSQPSESSDYYIAFPVSGLPVHCKFYLQAAYMLLFKQFREYSNPRDSLHWIINFYKMMKFCFFCF